MKLKKWLDMQQISPVDFAIFLGVSHPTVYRWRNGKNVPRMEILKTITAITGGDVTANDFLPPD